MTRKELFCDIEQVMVYIHLLIVVAAKDVVRRLLCVDPAQRISLAELLRHSWFSVSVE